MMGRQDRDQGQLFYEFSLDETRSRAHLLPETHGTIRPLPPPRLSPISIPLQSEAIKRKLTFSTASVKSVVLHAGPPLPVYPKSADHFRTTPNFALGPFPGYLNPAKLILIRIASSDCQHGSWNRVSERSGPSESRSPTSVTRFDVGRSVMP
jgi:hypothetical protein